MSTGSTTRTAMSLRWMAMSVVGVIALRGERPFSLDQKLGPVDDLLPAGRRVCELRLLAVKPAHRTGQVFRGLVESVVREGRAQGYDLAIISGTLRQTRLYQHLGFEPFGRPGGHRRGAVPADVHHVREIPGRGAGRRDVGRADELPARSGADRARGARRVRAAAGLPPRRGIPAVRLRARRRGCAGSPAPSAWRSCSDRARSPTTRWPLSSRSRARPAWSLSNGEFGRRLIDHARRHRLPHAPVESAWGQPLNLAAVDDAARRTGARVAVGRRQRDVDGHAERSRRR